MVTDDEMWKTAWMREHFDELGPLGQKFADDLFRGRSIQKAMLQHTVDAIKAQIAWEELADFEQCIHRKMEAGYRNWRRPQVVKLVHRND